MTSENQPQRHLAWASGRPQYVVPYSERGSTFDEEELRALSELIRSDSTLSCGRERKRFESLFKEYVGTAFAIALSSCTTALECATHLLRLQPGDEVIAQSLTYQSTALPLLTRPVTVRWCDVESGSLVLDPHRFESLITPRTKALFLTHYGGLMADMKTITRIAERFGIIVVEDCAHALGSMCDGHTPGSVGHIGCFSFQGMKNISTLGQGGMITFDRPEWADVISRIRATDPDAEFRPRKECCIGPYARPTPDLNRHEKNAYTHDCMTVRHPGLNGTLSEAAAVVGCVQLTKLSRLVERRRQISHRLNSAISRMPGLQVQHEPPGRFHSFHLYTFFVDSNVINRDALSQHLLDAGIEVQLRYFPLHLLPEWRARGHALGECPVLEHVWFEQLMNLPCYPHLSDDQVRYMIDVLDAATRSARMS